MTYAKKAHRMMVGCENDDGTLNIHAEDSTCSVCEGLQKPKACVAGSALPPLPEAYTSVLEVFGPTSMDSADVDVYSAAEMQDYARAAIAATPNPIESVDAWCSGVGHGPEARNLYLALILEETAEMLDAIEIIRRDVAGGANSYTVAPLLKELSKAIRAGDEVLVLPGATLDAALDTAWVSLCLARTLTGEKLPAAWAELHRSNVTDKQVDGAFIKDASGKIQKPDGWQPPNFAQFLLSTGA